MASDRHKVFRLRGIPLDYHSRSDVRALVKTVLSIEARAAVTVHSLCASPSQDNSRVATLSFLELPVVLSKDAKTEWVVPLPIRDGSDEDEEIPQKPLLFDTHFSGFTPLQHCDDDACNFDLIALSGLGGHAFGSFKERGGTFMWLRDALPLDLPNARILIYGYDTRVHRSNSFQNLTDLGRTLHVGIKGIRLSRERSYSARPIVFIGHSLGGLVLKEAIIKMKEGKKEDDVAILNATIAFMFFGVPHEGMAIESLVPLIKDQPNRGLLESLNKNSSFLQRLKNDFDNAFDAKRPPVVSFYETEKSPTAIEVEPEDWKLSGPLEVLVDVSSATYGSKYQNPINRSHSEMVKFTSHYDEVYERVQLSLRPLVTEVQRMTAAENMGTGVPASATLSGEQKECLRSLAFKEQDRRYHEIHSSRGTCDWLLQDAYYQSWMNKERGLFWIKGNPGTGKSVLMKFAFTRMKERKSGELVLSFFIHGRGMPLQRTPLGLFRSLLNSMLDLFPEYISELTEKFEEREKRFGSYHEKRWEWEEKELEEFISLVLTEGTKDRPTVIYVDALDECGETTAKSLLEYFKLLMSDIERQAGKVKICFSSRHYPVLGLSPISTIFVENRNDDDIRYVIKELLSEVQPKGNRQQIEEEILTKAQGGFQWAVLVAAMAVDKSSNGMKADKVHEKIKIIPEALEELYGNILGQVTQDEQPQTIKLFQWVLFAERPLSAQELREALATDEDMSCNTTSEMRNHQDWSDTIDEFETRVKYLSRGLVEFQTREFWEQYEVDGEDSDREAQFIHQSVPDYLLKRCLSPVGYSADARLFQVGASHSQISRSCIRYLTLRDVLEQNHLPRGRLSAMFPLAPYAVQFLFSHIHKVDAEGILQSDLLQLIHWDEQSRTLRQVADLWRVLDYNSAHTPLGWPFIGATALHVLVASGAHETFNEFLRNENIDVDGRDSERNTPFMLAIREGHTKMALTLLNRSVCWQSRYKTIDENGSTESFRADRKKHLVNIEAENNDGDTPMALAVTEQDTDLIYQLLDAGANYEAFDGDSQLIFHAIRARHKPLFGKLIEKHVKLDGAIYVAVSEASGDEDDDMKEFISELFKAGANTCRLRTPEEEEEGDDGRQLDEDAILVAARRGHTAIVVSLLLHGAPVGCQGPDSSTPLIRAAEGRNEETVRAILERAQSTVDLEDADGYTALWHAINKSDSATAKLLITEGSASIAGQNFDGAKILETAVAYDLLNVVEAILQRKDEPAKAIVSQSWKQALVIAFDVYDAYITVDGKNEDMINLLIDHGDVSEPFGIWLIHAATRGLMSSVEAILQRDVSTANFIDTDGRSALSSLLETDLAKDRTAAIAELLIANGDGSTINIGPSGRTPLMFASIRGSYKIMEAILRKDKSSIDFIDKEGSCALHHVMKPHHEEAAMLLIDKNASTSIRDSWGKTPLMLAIQNNLADVVEAIIQKDASSLDTFDDNGMTPLLHALRLPTDELAIYLLTETNASTAIADRAGRTPLIIATLRGYAGFIEALVQKDSTTLNNADEDGITALAYAKILRTPKIEKILTTAGQASFPGVDMMEVSMQDLCATLPQPTRVTETYTSMYPSWEDGKTLLMHAALAGNLGVAKTLLCRGNRPSLNVVDAFEKTALWYAVQGRKHEIVRLLIETEEARVPSNLSVSEVIMAGDNSLMEHLLRSPGVIPDFPSRHHVETTRSYSIEHRTHGFRDILVNNIDRHQEKFPPIIVATAFEQEVAISCLLNTGMISLDSLWKAYDVALALDLSDISRTLFGFARDRQKLELKKLVFREEPVYPHMGD